ncbi:AI-2E family transporter [candidate division KSB1 bacterium]|nr:AI-2E family transporter [candidate division KSB1 bacterium]
MAQNKHNQWQVSSLRESRLTTFLLGILVVLAVGFVLLQMASIFQPLMIAIFLSFIFEPMVNALTRIKIPKVLAFLITLVFVFAIFYLVGLLIYASVASFTDEFPKYQVKLIDMYKSFINKVEIPDEQVRDFFRQIRWSDLLQKFSINAFLSATIGTFLNFLTKLFLVLLITIYIALGREHMLNKVKIAFPDDRSTTIYNVIHNINIGIQKYLITKIIISLGTGVIATIILFVFGVDFAIVWGLLTFLLNFIPNVGSIIATIPPILVSFVQFGSFLPTMWLTILLTGTQLTMGNFIEPRLMGKNLNLSPLVVIISLIFWAFIWGPVGMVLAVPISSTIQIICANIDTLKPIAIFMGGDDKV